MTHRLFVAVRPPDEVRDALIDTIEGLDGARWQADEQLHLTLRFIGEVDTPVANDLAAAFAGIVAPPFDLSLEGVSYFERKGMPTSIWARVPLVPELTRLQRKVERACQSVGLPPESRRFMPHITIARLPRTAGWIAPWLARHAGLRTTWPVEEFILFESHLLASGAHYEAVAHFPL